MANRELEVFLTLAEELHFGRTAERLHLSQARVSQTIGKIERQIGAVLFERTSRRVALTPIGAQLRAELEPAHRQIRDAIARAAAAARGVRGELRLGFESPSLAELVTGLLSRFQARHPDCALTIREVEFRDPLRMLRDGEVDVLVTLFPLAEPDLVAGPVVHSEPMVLAVGAHDPLALREFVTLDDLASGPVLRASRPPAPYWDARADPWVTPRGLPIRRGRAVSTFQELMLAVVRGEGICPLAGHAAQFFARPTVAFVPFRGTPHVQWGLAWRAAGETALVRAFAEAASPGSDEGWRGTG